MRKDTLFFAATTAFAAVVAFIFWSELREKDRLMAELQQVHARAAMPRDTPVQPANGDVPPSADASATPPAPQAVQTAAGDAFPPPPALQPMGCDEERLARARQSAESAVAQMATELQLHPDEVQRVTRAREAELIARLPCASAGGFGLDLDQLNQLQEQFLAALGPARVEQLLGLNAERETRTTMVFLPRQFADNGMPLTDDQTRQLTALLHDENRRAHRNKLRNIPSGPNALLASMEQELKRNEDRWGRLLTAAQSILSPGQLAQWRDSSVRGIEQTRSTIQMWRERAERGENIPAYMPPLSLVTTVAPPSARPASISKPSN